MRIIIEKPFGRDLASARALNHVVLEVFEESQVYRIDHYLGKDTVQNLLALRFGNGIFEPLWNRNYMDHVQITVAESLGVEQRAAFYETCRGDAGHDAKPRVATRYRWWRWSLPQRLMPTICATKKSRCCNRFVRSRRKSWRGMWFAANMRQARRKAEKACPATAKSPASAPVLQPRPTWREAAIDNWRWAGVPFYLRTGKSMARQVSEIAIQFRRAPHLVFRGEGLDANWLVLNIQPEEGISICFYAKLPGQEMRLKQVSMNFSYHGEFGAEERSAYATLMADCMRGDATLFDRADGVEAAWALVDPISDSWRENKAPFPNYAAGSWGPRESEELLERDGRQWRKP